MPDSKQYTKDVRELVVQRLLVLPSDRRVVIGGHGDFTKEQLIEHVEKEDDIGKIVVEMELSFLRALAQGKLFS
jgi:hypothetical protein